MEEGKASIIVATKNRKDILVNAVEAMLTQQPLEEIIVINDGSTDGTEIALEKLAENKKVRTINLKESKGPATARNKGIKVASGEFIVIMDDDCIPKKNWLKNLLEPFKKNKNVGITSSYSYYGGTSTAYRTELMKKINGFDERFRTNYREDTDTVFKILDLGYSVETVDNALFDHIHKQPSGLLNKAKYGWKRIWIHANDALLYKNHPERTKELLDIRLGVIRNPWKDFEVATGLWQEKGKRTFALGSPQGVTLIEGKSPLHMIAIIMMGVCYVILVKLARLYGSVKFGKILV